MKGRGVYIGWTMWRVSVVNPSEAGRADGNGDEVSLVGGRREGIGESGVLGKQGDGQAGWNSRGFIL